MIFRIIEITFIERLPMPCFFLSYDSKYEALIETVFVYHDIDLWTDQQLAYLEPSEEVILADNERILIANVVFTTPGKVNTI